MMFLSQRMEKYYETPTFLQPGMTARQTRLEHYSLAKGYPMAALLFHGLSSRTFNKESR